MNQNALIYMVGTLIKASIGVSDGKGYVNTDTIDIRETLTTMGKKGLTGRAEFSDGSYIQFINGIMVGGYTTEGGDIK